MKRDISSSAAFQQARALFEAHFRPGAGLIAHALDIHASGDVIAFAGVLLDRSEGAPSTRICTLDAETGRASVRTHGSATDRLPRVSPDEATIAFLSDRAARGNFQPWLLDTTSWLATPAPAVDGFAESLEWSRAGGRLLMVVAGAGADLSGAQGGFNPHAHKEALADWMPAVDTGPSDDEWRSAWVVEMSRGRARRVSGLGCNVWEAAWCGVDRVVAITSESPAEGAWYSARVTLVDGPDVPPRSLYQPARQIGGIAASPEGRLAAVIEAVCSDRTIVAGDIVIIPTDGSAPSTIPSAGVDVSYLRFIDDQRIMFAGQRSFETVLGIVDVASGAIRILWSSDALTFGASRYPEFAPLDGDRALVTLEGFTSAPTIAILGEAPVRPLVTLGSPELIDEIARTVAPAEPVRWSSVDGLEIHGWLIRPTQASGPMPTVMEIHGGPVWMWRSNWLGGAGLRRMLLARGYALFLPNPRGSSGRGQDYASRVFGDMGGADTQDYLTGLDHLTRNGTADGANLFVTGGSYGGFMSSWLVTQDQRFAAAAPVAPVTNWYSEHLSCHIPSFCSLFLDADIREQGNQYHSRSPVFQADRVTTPVLNIAGARDRNTPPGQALEFHHALLEHGKKSAFVLYPNEGHGVRTFPALFDFAARVVEWFEAHRRGEDAATR